MCSNRALRGDWEGARHWALRSADSSDQAASVAAWKDFYRSHHQIEALMRGGDEALARREVAAYEGRISRSRRFRLNHRRMLTVLARWAGDVERAIGHAREAEALAEEMGLPGELWQVRAGRGEMHEHQGERREAREAFSAAAVVLRRLVRGIEDGALRESLLSSPRARRVLNEEPASAEGL